MGSGPLRIAAARLRGDRWALAFALLFVLLVLSTLAAPLWSEHVAHRSPSDTARSDETVQTGNGEKLIVSLKGRPIGPTWRGEYFLGADPTGRDVMVRLLYGGRNSLLIGLGAALVTVLLGTMIGLVAGYAGGRIDAIARGALDAVWAFPAILLGIALGTALSIGGISVGPIELEPGSLAIPIGVIAIAYVPYLARPVRAEVTSLRTRAFVDSARVIGMGPIRVMRSEILPNIASTLVIFVPILAANAILLEAALSFLGAGVQEPDTSWGTMISEGVDRIITAPHLAVAPGLMLLATVLALNVMGEGVRDALDPRRRKPVER